MQPDEKRTGAKVLSSMYEWVEWAAGVCILAVLILTFFIRTVGVFGESMEPTLIQGDLLLTTRITSTEAGDIVAVAQPNASNKPLVKRVIATAGQTVDIDKASGHFIVDGEVLVEPYLELNTTTEFGDMPWPVTVPEGFVFALGDNRDNSWDSRYQGVGMIDQRYVLGNALLRVAPLDRFGRP